MAGKIMTLPLASIVADKVCRIRSIDGNYVKDIAAIARQQIEGDKARGLKGIDAVRVFAGEPFPRIIVRALPLEELGKGAKGEAKYGAQKYGIVGGYHRWRAASEELKLDALEVEVREYKSDAEALADAIDDNITHGKHLSKDDRDEAIRKLHKEYKVTVRDLAKRYKLGIGSISRICNMKQRTGQPRKKATKKKGGTKAASAAAVEKASGFSPVQYVKELVALDKLFHKYAAQIADAMKKTGDKKFLTSEFAEFVSDYAKK